MGEWKSKRYKCGKLRLLGIYVIEGLSNLTAWWNRTTWKQTVSTVHKTRGNAIINLLVRPTDKSHIVYPHVSPHYEKL